MAAKVLLIKVMESWVGKYFEIEETPFPSHFWFETMNNSKYKNFFEQK